MLTSTVVGDAPRELAQRLHPLRLVQPLLELLALADVDEGHDGADMLAPPPDGKRPALREKRRAVGAPEHFSVEMDRLRLPEPLFDRTVLRRVGSPVRSAVVYQPMHVLAGQQFRCRIAEQADTGRIGEGTSALEIKAVDGLGGGIEQQMNVLFPFAQLRLRALPLLLR